MGFAWERSPPHSPTPPAVLVCSRHTLVIPQHLLTIHLGLSEWPGTILRAHSGPRSPVACRLETQCAPSLRLGLSKA